MRERPSGTTSAAVEIDVGGVPGAVAGSEAAEENGGDICSAKGCRAKERVAGHLRTAVRKRLPRNRFVAENIKLHACPMALTQFDKAPPLPAPQPPEATIAAGSG